MGMHMNRYVRVFGTDCPHDQTACGWLHDSRHGLDGDYMDVVLYKPVDNLHVVLEAVLGARRKHITCIHDGSFDETSGCVNRFDSYLQILQVIEAVKDAENIDACLLCQADEVEEGILWESQMSLETAAH